MDDKAVANDKREHSISGQCHWVSAPEASYVDSRTAIADARAQGCSYNRYHYGRFPALLDSLLHSQRSGRVLQRVRPTHHLSSLDMVGLLKLSIQPYHLHHFQQRIQESLQAGSHRRPKAVLC